MGMFGMIRLLIKFVILTVMLLGLPLLGIWVAGYPVLDYLEFPPQTRYVRHAPFSGLAFTLYGIFIAACTVPLIVRALKPFPRNLSISRQAAQPFPAWGWLGLILGMVAWILAWTRFSWFSAFQPHTFTPLWIAFIVVINAFGYRQSGYCMLLCRPLFFLMLFPTSAVFWWFFEYLNRFVQNWYYVGPEFNATEYFWYATLPFATVLPAVLGLRDMLMSTRWLQQRFDVFMPLQLRRPKTMAALILLISAGGLTGIGIWPNFLFPLLWVSPLLIIVCLQTLMSERHLLSNLTAGNWTPLVAAALAALICGFFWEMWNVFSLAKWKYSIPMVHRFAVFEMPLLGYAGYLPFGLQCAVVGSMLDGRVPAAAAPEANGIRH
jgi:hypothetical protein